MRPVQRNFIRVQGVESVNLDTRRQPSKSARAKIIDDPIELYWFCRKENLRPSIEAEFVTEDGIRRIIKIRISSIAREPLSTRLLNIGKRLPELAPVILRLIHLSRN